MSGEFKRININKIINYHQNPRHDIGNSEEDTLKKLFNSVGNQYMFNLAEDIQENGLLANQQIVVVPLEGSNNYIVYEGNRRVAALKLLNNPDRFTFLNKTWRDKANIIAKKENPIDTINCYVTDEQEAFFIMERTHSGEDKGRGVKKWGSKEKETFKTLQNHKPSIAYFIDIYVKKYFNNFDITSLLSFTTIDRIFNTKRIKDKIGISTTDTNTFTYEKMDLIINASKWIVEESKREGVSITRLFNKVETIEEKLLPWIQDYLKINSNKTTNINNNKDTQSNSINPSTNTKATSNANQIDKNEHQNNQLSNNRQVSDGETDYNTKSNNSKVKLQPPYFFQGLSFYTLNPNDITAHGIITVCRELKFFSDKQLVEKCPFAAAFLIRSIIEQSIKYYSKKHNIQAQDKLIWEDIKNIDKLSSIIKKYNKNLPNYITDPIIRQYFTNLFGNFEDNIDPLNWVIHRPFEYRIDATHLIELPQKGLLAIINFLIS